MDIARRFKVDHKTTSTAAELVAIREAIRFISGERPRAWTIFCDAKPALQTNNCIMKQGPYYSLAIEISELIQVASTKWPSYNFPVDSRSLRRDGKRRGRR
uniref:Putative tick transposon n=1 Tax=Rhipicephalus microplus TaxID=6941 RepID=A0A6G5AGD0_RHIMP